MDEAGGETDVNISIVMPEGDGKKAPTDFCCLVDVSGSMSSPAINENCDANAADDGFSILDIVKHSVNAVMHMLDENDRVSMVVFSDNAELVFPLT